MPERLGAATDLRRVLDAMPNIVWVHRAGGEPLYFNARWTEYTGLDLAQTLEVGAERLVHPDDLPKFRAAVAEGQRAEQPFDAEYRLRRGVTGEWRWHHAYLVPMRDEQGTVVAWIGTASDVDDDHRRDREQTFLVHASSILGTSLDVKRTLSDVAALVVPELSDWCAIDLLDAEGGLVRMAVAHVDPSKVAVAHEIWKRQPPKPDDPQGEYAVMRTREPQLLADISDELIASAVTDPEILGMLRALGLRSSMCVPLVARDTVLGALTLVSAESGRRYGDRDLRFATDFARRIAIALENAQLYTAAEQARRAAEAIAADVVEQSKQVEAALLAMRRERDEARARIAERER